MQRSVFVDRRRSQTSGQRDEIAARLADKDDLVLLREDRWRREPRSAVQIGAFAVAEREVEGRPLTVQPVSITYTRLDGMPMGRFLRPFCRYGDMSLPAMLGSAGPGIVTVSCSFTSRSRFRTMDRARPSRALPCVVAGGVADALGAGGCTVPRPADQATGGSAAADATASWPLPALQDEVNGLLW